MKISQKDMNISQWIIVSPYPNLKYHLWKLVNQSILVSPRYSKLVQLDPKHQTNSTLISLRISLGRIISCLLQVDFRIFVLIIVDHVEGSNLEDGVISKQQLKGGHQEGNKLMISKLFCLFPGNTLGNRIYDEHRNLYSQISSRPWILTSTSPRAQEVLLNGLQPGKNQLTIVTCCSWDYGYGISTTAISCIQFAKKQKFSQCQDTGGKDPDPSIPVMPRDFVISSQVRTESCVFEPPFKRLTQAQQVTSTHFRWELSNRTFRCFNSPHLAFPVSWHDSSSNHLASSNKLRSFFHGSGLRTPVNLPLAIYLRDLMMKQKVDLSETWRF